VEGAAQCKPWGLSLHRGSPREGRVSCPGLREHDEGGSLCKDRRLLPPAGCCAMTQLSRHWAKPGRPSVEGQGDPGHGELRDVPLRSQFITLTIKAVSEFCTIRAVGADSPHICKKAFSYPPGLKREMEERKKGWLAMQTLTWCKAQCKQEPRLTGHLPQLQHAGECPGHLVQIQTLGQAACMGPLVLTNSRGYQAAGIGKDPRWPTGEKRLSWW
jgi:hypothetical protein